MALVNEVERILGTLVQEFEKDASVLVQFASGDWAALKQAFLEETGQATPAPTPVETPVADLNPIVDVVVPVVDETPVVEAPVVADTPVIELTPVVDTPAIVGDEPISQEASDSLSQSDAG